MMHTVPENIRYRVILWYVVQHSVSSFNKLIQYFQDAESALQSSAFPIWQQLKLHKNHLERFKHYQTAQGKHDIEDLWKDITQFTDYIIDRSDPLYPDALTHFTTSPPILFIKGNAELLRQPQIAIVGSRTPSPHGHQVAYDFADYFSSQGYITTSGLALGIDAAAHQGAMRIGRTIAVIGTGLDQCYPKSHQNLQNLIVENGGCIVTQFLPNTPPLKVNFPKRNHIISGMSLCTLVVEAGLESGSLITAKAAAEQGKQVFAIPGHIYSQHHQGCHQLIREGATLVDHPAQVLEDIQMFNPQHNPKNLSSTIKQADIPIHQSVEIPHHLQSIYDVLDWTGISLDSLAQQLNIAVSDLTVYLMELELLGLCKQHAGRYIRC